MVRAISACPSPLLRQIELFAGAGVTGRVPDGEERYLLESSMSGPHMGDIRSCLVRNTEATTGGIYRRGSSYVKPTLFFSTLDNYILVNDQPLLNPVMGMTDISGSAREGTR